MVIPKMIRPVKLNPVYAMAQRAFCYRWMNKNRDIYYPHDHLAPEERSNSNHKRGRIQYRSQDPLWIDDRLHHIEGGIKAYMEKCHENEDYALPLRNICFILYNAGKEGIQDKKIYRKFEEYFLRPNLKGKPSV